jgi:hypothetical protein
VDGLSVSEEQGRLRLRVRVVGPVIGDIMVFGAAPCSAGRKKWRHGAFLGLLPAHVGGESDITELYVERYGEPKAGERVFIRTRQQRDGWEDDDKDISGMVQRECRRRKAERGMVARRGLAEIRRKPENRSPNAAWSGGLLRSPGRLVLKRCTREQYRSSPIPAPWQCRRGEGEEGRLRNAECGLRNRGEAVGRRKGHWRELWRGT